MPSIKDKNILIVDDDKDLTNLYETFLKYDGYEVELLLILLMLCTLLKKDVYDLALLDLEIPKMNGVELSQELQNIHPTLFLDLLLLQIKNI